MAWPIAPGWRGGASLLSLKPELICIRSDKFIMRQIDRLLEIAARNNKLTKRSVEVDGELFEFWTKPMTIEEYQLAKSSSKNPEDGLETAIRLFVSKALDESGVAQYQSDAIPVLKKLLPMEFSSKLIGALTADEAEDEDLDFKSPEASVQKGKQSGK